MNAKTEHLVFKLPDVNTENNDMLNSNIGLGQLKGFLAFSSSLLGLTISWTHMHDIIKFITSLIAMLAGIFFLSCAIYDRFNKKSNARRRHNINIHKTNKIFTQENK